MTPQRKRAVERIDKKCGMSSGWCEFILSDRMCPVRTAIVVAIDETERAIVAEGLLERALKNLANPAAGCNCNVCLERRVFGDEIRSFLSAEGE